MSLGYPGRVKDLNYLEWVRKQPCSVCMKEQDITAHHMIPVGAGGSDHFAIPACPTCHRLLQDRNWLALKKLFGFTEIDGWHAVARLEEAWMSR